MSLEDRGIGPAEEAMPAQLVMTGDIASVVP
jgi:hypothetical protein